MPMKIVERLAIIADRCAQKAAPKGTSAFAARAQALMLSICDLPQLVKAEFRNHLGNLGGHSDQEGGKADILPGSEPRNRQRVSCHLHANDPWEQASAEIHAIRTLPTLGSLPPIYIGELQVGKNERAPARSQPCLGIHRTPETFVTPQNMGHFFGSIRVSQ
jgi:hypothetical protein